MRSRPGSRRLVHSNRIWTSFSARRKNLSLSIFFPTFTQPKREKIFTYGSSKSVCFGALLNGKWLEKPWAPCDDQAVGGEDEFDTLLCNQVLFAPVHCMHHVSFCVARFDSSSFWSVGRLRVNTTGLWSLEFFPKINVSVHSFCVFFLALICSKWETN